MKLKITILLLLLVGVTLSQESNDSITVQIDKIFSDIYKINETQKKLDSLLIDTKAAQKNIEANTNDINNTISGIQTQIEDHNNSINSEMEIIKKDFKISITELKELINQNLRTNNIRFDALDNNVTSLTDSLLTASHRILIMKDQDSYDKAFNAARLKLGPDKTFEWRGNKFKTDYEDEDNPPETIKFLEQMRDSVKILESTLKTSIESANALKNNLLSYKNQHDQTIDGIDETISKQTLSSIIAILVVLILFIAIFVFFKLKMGEQIDSLSSIRNTQEKLESETIDLDKKLLQILEQKLEITNLQPQQTQEVDHSLPLTLGSEIHRMRKRLKTMEESQGTKVLNKRIESLEEKLHDMGYEIVNLEGEPFDERMTLNVVNIIESEGFVQNEKKITRVIKPQIKFNDKIIQPGDIELTQGV